MDKIKENIKDEMNENNIRNDIKEFRKKFDDLLEETKIDKLIIFIGMSIFITLLYYRKSSSKFV